MGLMKGSGGGGEIVQVQGGHIVRETGRKDRHSKVYTSKGPRDRRVRLSAHTAIQFYDVQDRLGFDRPSKAIDWLIKKAKLNIDKLAEIPPWVPPSTSSLPAGTPPQTSEVSLQAHGNVNSTAALGDGGGPESPADDGYDSQIHRETGLNSGSAALSCSSSLFSSQMDTTPFFATSSGVAALSSVNFDDYCSSNDQDLGLSLLPLHAPNFGQQHGDHINQAAIFPMMVADCQPLIFNPPPPLAQPLFLSQTQSSAGILQRGNLQSLRSYEEFQPIHSSSSAHRLPHHQHSMLPGFRIQSQMQQGDEHGSAVSGRPTLSSSSPGFCR